jgi:hypothetical protein
MARLKLECPLGYSLNPLPALTKLDQRPAFKTRCPLRLDPLPAFDKLDNPVGNLTLNNRLRLRLRLKLRLISLQVETVGVHVNVGLPPTKITKENLQKKRRVQQQEAD